MKPIAIAALVLVVILARCNADEPETPVDTFYQQVDIQRMPRFAVQGVNVSQQVHYQIQSLFELYAADAQELRKVVQTVSSTTLVEADLLSKAVIGRSLAEMQGRVFVYKLDKSSRIVSMVGHQNSTQLVNVQQPESQGMLVSTVIDEDGWRELAELTLFQPPQSGRSNRSFARKTNHDWGSLGSWYGETKFEGSASGPKSKRFVYKHQLEYTPPSKLAPRADTSLPFEIESATFRADEARGEIYYDSTRERVTSVREYFHARGTITTTMLGLPSTVDVEERQIFAIHVTPQRVLSISPPQQR